SELSALKAQLNPHFLYNVFNTINAAIPSSAKSARDMVNKLSDLFRYQLKASREEVVALKEELDFVEKYLDLEKERFGDRLLFEIDVKQDVLNVEIPPMLIQPIVENSIKHGISPLIEGGKISLHISSVENQLEIVISDTGTGIGNQQKSDLLKQGVGLSNTNERLQKMYGNEMELMDNTPKGLRVKFTLPINKVSKLL
ncbi:MAG: histidine kinase, partial [Bacteroidota bacterium]